MVLMHVRGAFGRNNISQLPAGTPQLHRHFRSSDWPEGFGVLLAFRVVLLLCPKGNTAKVVLRGLPGAGCGQILPDCGSATDLADLRSALMLCSTSISCILFSPPVVSSTSACKLTGETVVLPRPFQGQSGL